MIRLVFQFLTWAWTLITVFGTLFFGLLLTYVHHQLIVGLPGVAGMFLSIYICFCTFVLFAPVISRCYIDMMGVLCVMKYRRTPHWKVKERLWEVPTTMPDGELTQDAILGLMLVVVLMAFMTLPLIYIIPVGGWILLILTLILSFEARRAAIQLHMFALHANPEVE